MGAGVPTWVPACDCTRNNVHETLSKRERSPTNGVRIDPANLQATRRSWAPDPICSSEGRGAGEEGAEAHGYRCNVGSAMPNHILIAGATGLVGQAAMHHFAAHRGAVDGETDRITAVSRRAPERPEGVEWSAVDLTDAAACARFIAEQPDVTHLVYAALYEKPGLYPGWFDPEQIETNRAMFANLLEPLCRADGALRHVTLLQGTKAYGAHARPLPIPAREGRDEARDIPNFYWEQEDLLRARAAESDWHFTILRPQVIFGVSIGSAMNLLPALGVYGALLKHRGEPLAYPGGAAPVMEAVDADLLARVIAWAGRTEAARDQVFNVTNGDVFSWTGMWPAIADALGMEPGAPEPLRLGEAMPAYAKEWDALRKQHGLVAPALADFVGESFHYADFVMAHGADGPIPPALVSSVRLRAAGFHEVMDSEAMFRRGFEALQQARLLPPR